MSEQTKEHNLYVQSEHTRGEGTAHFVECSTHTFCDAIRGGSETYFFGRGAKQKAEKRLREILEGGETDDA